MEQKDRTLNKKSHVVTFEPLTRVLKRSSIDGDSSAGSYHAVLGIFDYSKYETQFSKAQLVDVISEKQEKTLAVSCFRRETTARNNQRLKHNPPQLVSRIKDWEERKPITFPKV